MREKVACFTGHRPQGLPWGFDEGSEGCAALKAALREAVLSAEAGGIVHFIAGGALGVDTYAAEAVIDARRELPVTLEIAVPCRGQEGKWAPAARRRYRDILAASDRVTVLSESYTPWCMQRRNRYMVDRSGLIIAALYKGGGGTGKTIEYARQSGLEIRLIDIGGL